MKAFRKAIDVRIGVIMRSGLFRAYVGSRQLRTCGRMGLTDTMTAEAGRRQFADGVLAASSAGVLYCFMVKTCFPRKRPLVSSVMTLESSNQSCSPPMVGLICRFASRSASNLKSLAKADGGSAE